MRDYLLLRSINSVDNLICLGTVRPYMYRYEYSYQLNLVGAAVNIR
eukprot:SAG31_NODE_1590_length_7805_cov_3.417390_7_plen_46_part_00